MPSTDVNITGATTDEVQETLKAHALLWNHALSFIKSMCLKCAVELGIPDSIHRHGMPITIAELLQAISIPEAKARRLRILMRLLSREGIFKFHVTLSGEEAFDLTSISRLLITGTDARGPSSSPFILLLLDQHFVDPCQQLSRWFHLPDVATTPFEMTHGKSLWELAGDRPEFNDLFNKGMASDSGFVMDVVTHIGGDSFRGVRSLVDVGGGSGMTAAALSEAFPELKLTVFDLPHVVGTAQKREGIQYVGGDMFVKVPSADAALLKWILHDWSDEDCVKILQRCKEAIPPKEKGGKVIIIDMVVGVRVHTGTSGETQLLFDLEMMILTTGKERDESEWRKLFVAAGFSNYKITPSVGLRSIIEVYP